MEQRFTLVGLPLHRDLQAPVTIGTQFSVRATPIEHDKRIISLTLITDKGEAALEITIHLPDKHGRGGKLRAVSRSATNESSPLEKEVSTLAAEKELILGVIVKEHVFEIYLDTVFLLPFVHRVNPSEIKKMALDGAMICNEVVIVPVKTDMPPLPQYNEVSLNTRVLQPTLPQAAAGAPPPLPPPRNHPTTTGPPVGGVAVLPPYPAGTAGKLPTGAAAASSIYKPAEPGWTAPAVPPAPQQLQQQQPVQMPQPQRVPPPAAMAAQQPQYPQLSQQMAQLSLQQQQQPLPPPPPHAIGAGAMPILSATGPTAPAVAPMQYGATPPQSYPPGGAPGSGPQFQNIQRIPGLSYEVDEPQPSQPPIQPQQMQQQYPYQPQQQYPQSPYLQQQQQQQQQQSPQSPYLPQQQQQQPYQPYPQYPGYQTPGAYNVQYQSYPTYPTAYYNNSCHYDYWHHHHC